MTMRRMPPLNLFDTYLHRWNAQVAGSPFATHTSDLLPVTLTGTWADCPAMIKIARDLDEQIGGQVLQWWGGNGSAHVYAYAPDTGALLMERATGARHLLRMALAGEDDAATRFICNAIRQLHSKRSSPPSAKLLSLTHFSSR